MPFAPTISSAMLDEAGPITSPQQSGGEASIPEDNVWAEIASFFATKLRAKREIPDYAHTIVGRAAAYDLRENTGNLIGAKDALVASAF